MIRLGDKVKDPITGFTGTVVARTTWLQGCARINIQPFGTDKDGKIFECQSFDEPQLVVIKAKTRKEPKNDKGGPRETMQSKVINIRR